MEISERFSATLVIPLAIPIKNARPAIKRHLLAVLTVMIWLSLLISSLVAWASVERTFLVKMMGGSLNRRIVRNCPNLSVERRRSGHVEVGF
jgi:hypothetical protein